MTTKVPPVCIGCAHFQGRNKNGRPVCSSFKDGIPKDIWAGDDPHVVARGDEAIYMPKDVAEVARFMLVWVLPYLNPRLTPAWGAVTRKLIDIRRAKENAPKPKPKKTS